MPLDDTAKKYAALLYQQQFEEIIEKRGQELKKVAADFGSRNTLQSGMYLSARAKVIGEHAGLMAEAMAQALAKAYALAGHQLDETTLREITTQVTEFCEGQQAGLRSAANSLVDQNFPNRTALVEALGQEMLNRFAMAASRAIQNLTLKHYEVVLERGRATLAYAAAMGKQWDVFISHASEDKESLVRPLARALEESGLQVWFDATALTVGDSLRGKIDEGLSRSRYGIVVLSPHFFAKPWPQWELDGLVSREVSGIKVILPIWHNIDHEGVSARSPMLAGRLAARSSDGIQKVVLDLRTAMAL